MVVILKICPFHRFLKFACFKYYTQLCRFASEELLEVTGKRMTTLIFFAVLYNLSQPP